MQVHILIATSAILIFAIVVVYYRLLHPYISKPTLKSVLIRLCGSVGLTLLLVFVVNSVIWILLWGNDWSVLFTERNIVLYSIVMGFTLVCSLGFTLLQIWKL